MASTASTGGVTEEARAEWWRRFNNGGVPADDGDDDEEEEEEEEGERGGAERRATYAVAGYGTAAETAARGVKAEMVARGGGGKAETETAGAGGMRRSSPRFADPAALDEEISGGNYLQPALPAEVPRRRKKAVAKRTRPNVNGTEVQNSISQAQSPPPVIKSPEPVCEDNQNLKLQLALKTAELKQEENRRLKLELILMSKETESLQKQIGDLKAENEQLRKNVKPKRVKRNCRSCNARAFHDYRNCPKRRKGASPPEEEDEDEDGEEPQKIERHCRSCDKYDFHDYRNCPKRREAATKRREAASSPEEEGGEDSD